MNPRSLDHGWRSRLPRRASPWLLLAALAFAGCKSATDLLYEPRPDDPNDGYRGVLAEAGVNTAMNWGPKQELLLAEFKTLQEQHKRLQDRLDKALGENQQLKHQIDDVGGSLKKEQALRVQAEGESENLKQKRRDLEARILALGIEKAKLEQALLRAKIDALQRVVENTPGPVEAAAPPAGRL